MDFKKIIFKTLISAAIISLPFTAKADIYKDNNIPNSAKNRKCPFTLGRYGQLQT